MTFQEQHGKNRDEKVIILFFAFKIPLRPDHAPGEARSFQAQI